MKIKYIPGLRPVPMLMYYTEKNKNVYDELANEMKISNITKFEDNGIHYWNMNAYLILDEQNNKIDSMVFSMFIYAIYLLRVINKEIIIELPDDYYELIKDDLSALKGEIEVL